MFSAAHQANMRDQQDSRRMRDFLSTPLPFHDVGFVLSYGSLTRLIGTRLSGSVLDTSKIGLAALSKFCSAQDEVWGLGAMTRRLPW
jgi:hypothetical protein